MSNPQGWVSLHRKLLENPIFKNHKLLQTFLYCLLKATHEDYKALIGDQLVDLKPGQLATGRKAISQATNLTEQNVRTALSKLEKLGILTITPTTKYSIITVVSWDLYQQSNQQVTNSQPTSNQQVTTNNNINNKNNSNKYVIPDGINLDSWEEWETYRKSKKKTISKHAAAKQFKLLLKYSKDQQAIIINQSIQNDYQGLFEPKGGNYENNSGNGPKKDNSAVGQVRANIERERAERRNRESLDNDGQHVWTQMDEQLRDGSGSGESVASIIEGDFTRSD